MLDIDTRKYKTVFCSQAEVYSAMHTFNAIKIRTHILQKTNMKNRCPDMNLIVQYTIRLTAMESSHERIIAPDILL